MMLAQSNAQHHIRRPDHACRVSLSVPQPVKARLSTIAFDSARAPIPLPPPEPTRPNRHSACGTLPAHLSRVPSLEAFVRRPPACGTVRHGPASETLHTCGSSDVLHFDLVLISGGSASGSKIGWRRHRDGRRQDGQHTRKCSLSSNSHGSANSPLLGATGHANCRGSLSSFVLPRNAPCLLA